MKTLVTGHRLFKLECYNIEWIKGAISDALDNTLLESTALGLSGMASGVDLWFCEELLNRKIPYKACIPFDTQADTMDEDSRILRRKLIESAAEVWDMKNSAMVSKADVGLVIWDGAKGGTHNVFQQMVENKKSFVWINPVNEKIYEIT